MPGVLSVGRGAVCLQLTQQRAGLRWEILFFFNSLIPWCSVVRARSAEHVRVCFLLHVIDI